MVMFNMKFTMKVEGLLLSPRSGKHINAFPRGLLSFTFVLFNADIRAIIKMDERSDESNVEQNFYFSFYLSNLPS